ncbi:aspartic peptidase domain-containing protein, partial [Podospora appendiculata]
MRANIALCVLLSATSCHGAIKPPDPPSNTASGAGTQGGEARKPGYVRLPVSRHVFNGTGRWPGGWHWTPPSGGPSGPGGGGPRPSPRPSQSGYPWSSGRPPFPQPSTSSLSSTVTKASPTSTQPGSSRRAQADRRWGWEHLEDLGGIAYILQLEIGTPPQKIKVFIDTGSYELWVNPKCTTSADTNLCQSYGNYYPTKSNSSFFVGGDFAITYGTGAVKGSYYSDIMSVAMFQIPSVQFAVASDSNYTFAGILGLGYSYPYSINYPSLLNLMVSAKMISAPIFSIGLGGEQDGFSEIIFGGINRWKFAGPLEPVAIWPPISQQDPHWIQYWINVTSVGLTRPNANPVVYTPRDTFMMPTLIDTGSTLSYIREDLVAQIGQQFQATVDGAGNYIVDCAYRAQNGTVDFGFNRGRMVINVRYKDFIYQQYPGHCMLGVQPADVGSTNYVLGDTFIRGAYCEFNGIIVVVFDQQSDVIWMNQYYNCGDGVVSVGLTARDTKNVMGAC